MRVVLIRTLVGSVAAVAFLFFFPTEQTLVVNAGGHSVTTITYPFLKVISLGLVVGTGGSAFLSAMRNQANSFITAANADKTTAAVKAATSIAFESLPKLAGEIAKSSALQQTQVTMATTSVEMNKVAHDLPSQLADPAVDPESKVMQAVAEAPGIDVTEVADPESGISAVSEAMDALPPHVESSVRNELQDQVLEILANINQIGVEQT